MEAYRIYSYLTRCASEMSTALAQLKAFAQKSQDEDADGRYASSSFTAAQLAGALGTAYSASGHLAYKERPSREA